MSKKLSLKSITKSLMEDMPYAELPEQATKAGPGLKSASGGSMTKPSYDKMASNKRKKPSLPKKAGEPKAGKNSGPAAAPKASKFAAKNASKEMKKTTAPNLKVNSGDKSPFVDAKDVKRSEATPVKFSQTSDSSTEKLIGKCISNCDPKSVKKITFSVSKPNIDYGIVPTGEQIKVSQSHAMKQVKAPSKNVSEGVINGTVTISIGARQHVYEAASTNMINRMMKNYASVGQPVSVDIKLGLRESYADRIFVESLFNTVHAKMVDIDRNYQESLKESFDRLVELLEGQYVEFHNRSKKEWINECVKPAYKQAFNAFKRIYEAHLEPFEISVKAQTRQGTEIFEVVSRALNEEIAASNAFDDVLSETGASAKVQYAFIGAKKYMAENSNNIFSGKIKFEDMPEGFKDAGFGHKTTTRINPKAPKVDKQKEFKKTRDLGAQLFKNGSAPGKNAERLADKKGLDKRAKTTNERPAPKKDSGPRWPN